ncbi:moesin/ezrin/radixin homolog 1-like [Atheta coriaria]|uniref:moesin/ezrin/radixin homolog 1-like n=1 Tax=Dalotia coriaria TaxID=877792 RepID=UPI0031F400F9
MSEIALLVSTATKELQFRFPGKRPARALFQEVCKNLSLREVWYFGLYYFGDSNRKVWIDQSQKKLATYSSQAKRLYFGIKYYPEDITLDVIEPLTRKYFYSEVRNDILKDRIYCPADTCVLLASYACQARHGDYDEDIDISTERLFPDRVMKTHKLTKAEFIQSVTSMWIKHKGSLTDEVMAEYLRLTQNLDMIGVHFFDITNQKGTHLVVGINPLGMNMYKPEDKLNPTTSFPWSEIANLNFRGRKFTIKTVDKKTMDVNFFSSDPKNNKQIMTLGIGYHQLYIRRRQPDSLEITEMKENAKMQRQLLEAQRDRLRRQQIQSEQVEARYKEDLKKLTDELTSTRSQLNDSLMTIKRLQERLAEIEAAKKELEDRQNELHQMMVQLEQAKHLEESERLKLEEEIRRKQEEVQRIQEEVEDKDSETKRLQEEMEEAKRQFEEFQARQIREQEEAEEARLRAEEERQRALEEAMTARDVVPELAEINQKLTDELKLLQSKLEETRKVEMESAEDRIHRENLRNDRDKYKTLSEIRRGNTNRRVEMFENF